MDRLLVSIKICTDFVACVLYAIVSSEELF